MNNRSGQLLFLSLFLVLAACSGADPGASPAAAGAALTPEALAAHATRLALADAADGSTDGVVAGCLPCGLGMKGLPEHAAQVGDYTLHLCSSACLSNFEADPAAGLEPLAHLYPDAQ